MPSKTTKKLDPKVELLEVLSEDDRASDASGKPRSHHRPGFV